MKRQTLQIGSALLATTALSTIASVASAGTIVTNGTNANAVATTFTAASLGAQVFGSTGSSTVSIGPQAILINFTNALTTTFDVEIESSNSDFTGSIGVSGFDISGGSQLSAISFTGCTVQVLTERILVEDCLATSLTGNPFDAMQISGIQYTNANGLATAGTSIALSGIVRGQSNNTFETISSRNVVTSANVLSDTFTAGSTLNINNLASPAFSDLSGGVTTGKLGNIIITGAGTVGTNLTTSLETDSIITAGLEITVTHGVLTDAATDAIRITGTAVGTSFSPSVIASAFNGNVASFNFAPGQILGSFDVNVVFDGTTQIQAWSAGTVATVYTSGTLTLSAPASDSGSLAALGRSGFSTQINTAQSSAGTGATLFQSFVRITNNGSVAGPVTILVRDDADGSSYGTYTTATISANSTLQVGMPAIESALGITASGQYLLTVSGPIQAYAQHIIFNSVDNFFVDLSGFRNGSGTNNP
jgi:hypothetical protein